jgi:hypothetical protein
MADKQIQTVRRDYAITPRTRPRGLWGQSWTVVLQPGYFFRTMPAMADTRSWLWAAILVLALTGISAVRQEALLNAPDLGTITPDFGGAPPGTDITGSGDIVSGGGGGGFEAGPGIPSDVGVPPTTPSGDTPDVTSTWTTALLTASGIILGWLVLAVLLSEVSLFNGHAPALGQNLQIAIWASIPLALMAALQLVFYAAGGKVGGSGVSGLLTDWEAYQSMSPFMRSLILSFTSRLTLFWLWSLILIYVGARMTLQGKWYASVIVVVAWAVVLVVAPVVAGTIKAPEVTEETALPGDLQTDFSISPDGEMPSDLTDPFGQPLQEGSIEVTPDVNPDGESTLEATAEGESTAEVTDENSESFEITTLAAPETNAQSQTTVKPTAAPASNSESSGNVEVVPAAPSVKPIIRPGG